MHLRKQSIVKARLVPSYAGEHKGEREPDDTLSNFSGWTIVLRLRDLSKVTQLLNQQDRKSLPLSAVYRHGRLVFKWQMAVFLMKASLSNKEKWLLCLQVGRPANLIRLRVCNIIRSVTTDRF